MKIEIVTRIACPIAEVWKLAAEDFTSVQTWSASVVTSKALPNAADAVDAPMGGRYCTFTDDPEGFGAREMITKFDANNHHLEFDVVPVNAPAAIPLKKNRVVLTLTALGPSETELRWVATPELKPHGYVMYPLVKLGLTKSFRGIVAELKSYAERGRMRGAA